MSPIEEAVLRSVVAPAVVAGVTLVGSGGLEPSRARQIQSVALALCFSLGSYLLIDRLSFPPMDVSESFTFVALLLGVFGLVAPSSQGARYVMRAVFTLAGLALVLWHIRASLTGVVHYRNLAAFFCLSLGAWSLGETNAAAASKPANIVAGFISIISVSLVSLFFASAVMANLAGTLAGQLGAALAVSLVFPKRVSIDAVLPFATAFVGLFAAAAHFYLDVNPWYLLATLWPIAALAVVRRLPLPQNVWVETIVVTILSAVPLGFLLNYLHSISGPLY